MCRWIFLVSGFLFILWINCPLFASAAVSITPPSIVANTSGSDEAVAVDADNSGTTVAVWQSGGKIYRSRQNSYEADWTMPSSFTSDTSDSDPAIATDRSGNWIVVWRAYIGTYSYTIKFSRSTNNGITWSTPRYLRSELPSIHEDTEPTIATDRQGNWVVVFTNRDGSDFDDDLLVSKSTDNGATWSTPSLVLDYMRYDDGDSASSPDHDNQPVLAFDGSRWVLAWRSNVGDGMGGVGFCGNNGGFHIFVASSSNGTYWQIYRCPSVPDYSANPDITVDGGNVVVVYDQGGDIYANVAPRPGLEQWSLPTIVNSDQTSTFDNQPKVSADADGGHIIAVWQRGYWDEKKDIYSAVSVDGGQNWSNVELVSSDDASGLADDQRADILLQLSGSQAYWSVFFDSKDRDFANSAIYQSEMRIVEDGDGDGFTSDVDCNDGDNTVYPGAQEICDGKDNDCNTSTADGSGEPWVGISCDGPDNDLCKEGVYSCSAGQQVCSDNTSNINDLCDGIDNDCNPATPDGAAENWIGSPCDGTDTDLCMEGSFGCSAGQQICSDNTSNINDLCDGIDNDCNPATPDGAAENWIGSPCDGADTDLCMEGSYNCTSGQQVCSDITSSTFDYCDGSDNDCNPATADGSAEGWYGDACDGADADLCLEGVYNCSTGQQACSDNTGDNIEICDESDNDCDGAIDEGLPMIIACFDGDDDGFGNREIKTETCGSIGDYVTDCTDCDDGDASISGCNTPPGDDPVTIVDEETNTEIQFPNVTAGGTTTVTPSANGNEPPADFEVEDGFGSSYFDIECRTADGNDCEWQTGSFVLVCFTWEEGAFLFEEGVSIWHENEQDQWDSVNCQPGLGECPNPNPDTVNNRVCAYVDHLSWFAVFQNTGLTVDLKEGLNLIAYSGEVPQGMTTYDLLQALGTPDDIEKIMTYSPSTGDYFTTYYGDDGNPAGNDKPVKNYFSSQVVAKNDKHNTFYYRTACGSTPLIAGKNEAGFNCLPDDYSAYGFLQDVGPVKAISIQRYNRETGMFETASFREDGTVAGVDFIIGEGEGYNVFMRQNHLWSAP